MICREKEMVTSEPFAPHVQAPLDSSSQPRFPLEGESVAILSPPRDARSLLCFFSVSQLRLLLAFSHH